MAKSWYGDIDCASFGRYYRLVLILAVNYASEALYLKTDLYLFINGDKSEKSTYENQNLNQFG
jgi:hypothetical protein